MAKRSIDPAAAAEAARSQSTNSVQDYLLRVPEGSFPNEFAELRKRLSKLTGEKAGESRYFPTASTTGDGIYVQGPKVIFKNVLDNARQPQNYDFFIDDVALVFHQASVFFLFLVFGISWQTSNYIVFCDRDNQMLAAVPPQMNVRDFLVHLMAVNPNTAVDKYTFLFVSGRSGVFGFRMFRKFLLAIFVNAAIWAVILFVAQFFF
jgi:hypothetical protein